MFFRRKAKEEGTVQEESAAQDGRNTPSDPQVALRDELGLYHLWYLEMRLQQELTRAARAQSVFSLAAWQWRLLPGEEPEFEALRQAAAIIAGRLRSYDIPARVDTQRFFAILFDADYRAACTVAFRIKGDLQMQLRSAGRWQAGVATFPRDGMDGNALIQAAFRRLDEDARAA